MDIDAAVDAAAAWADIDGVIVVAHAKSGGEDVIQVRATCPKDTLAGRIPATFHGFRVEIIDLDAPIQAGG